MKPVWGAKTSSGSVQASLGLDLGEAARLTSAEVLERLASSANGITSAEAVARLQKWGPNTLGTHGVTAWEVLLRQLRNPLLILLAGAALLSFFTGDHTTATIIFVISGLSVGVSFFNEYRSERAAEDLHARIHHRELVLRDGAVHQVDVTDLVPGDVVLLDVGDIVRADLRLLEASSLECDGAVVTGESMPVVKTVDPGAPNDSPLDLPDCALRVM